jgi:TfoX/Sxy family transcriptional regulator of competence genes
MGYNQDLENKIDHLTDKLGKIHKKKMFGGIGYLINGNMCFGIHKESLVLRISPEKGKELLKNKFVSPFNISGRSMKGWVLISPAILETEEQLLYKLKLGVDFALTLPGK